MSAHIVFIHKKLKTTSSMQKPSRDQGKATFASPASFYIPSYCKAITYDRFILNAHQLSLQPRLMSQTCLLDGKGVDQQAGINVPLFALLKLLKDKARHHNLLISTVSAKCQTGNLDRNLHLGYFCLGTSPLSDGMSRQELFPSSWASLY